ncbi:hypothetical protein BDV06DRAFT_192619, partial [Aspergillus oleicola]
MAVAIGEGGSTDPARASRLGNSLCLSLFQQSPKNAGGLARNFARNFACFAFSAFLLIFHFLFQPAQILCMPMTTAAEILSLPSVYPCWCP